jgi:hypothetical protein
MLESLPLTLIVLGHLLGVSAVRDAGGLQVYPGTGDLNKFPVITWRFNGGMQQWGSHPELDFVPLIKDEMAVKNVPGALVSWLASPEIAQVFSLEARKSFSYQRDTANSIAYLSDAGGLSAIKAAELQKQITSDIRGAGLGMFQLGTPSIKVQHAKPLEDGEHWLRVSRSSP